jgi:N-acetylglucosamine-6-phosphate deacetylase
MSPYHHREAGIVGAALVDAAIPYSVILDGVHLAPEAVRLAWKCNPKGLILITDATAALGLPNGRRKLGAMEIEVKEDRVVIEGTNTIAGSKTSLDQAVRNLHKIAGCTQAEALEAASAKPAEILQIYPQKGSLSMGADADFLVLSDRLEVQQTYIGGELAWSIKSEH